MKNEMEQDDLLRKALKEYGGEDPGQQFTFSVMDKVMAEQRSKAKARRPLLGWWFWSALAVMFAAVAGLAVFFPGSASTETTNPNWTDKLDTQGYMGAVEEKLPEISNAINGHTFLWFGLIALGAIVIIDRVLRNRRRVA